MTGHRGIVLVLTAFCLVAGAAIWRETGGAGATSDAPANAAPIAAPAPRPAAAKPGAGLPPMSAYAEVTERPLFAPSRQPAPPEAAQDDLGNSSSFTLLGIVIAEGERIALIQHGQPAIVARLKEGQAVEGWRVQTIEADRVILEHAGTQQPLKLKDLKQRPALVPTARPGVIAPPQRRS